MRLIERKKRAIVAAATLLATTAVMAIPAMRRWRTITLADGTQQKVMLVGDEHHSRLVTADGRTIVGEEGSYRFATSADTMQTAAAARRAFLAKHAANPNVQGMAKRAQMRRASTTTKGYTGSKRGLIILVQFPDKAFSMSNPKATFTDIANEVGYTSEFGTTGSVHDYFTAQSYGKFDLTFDVVGPVTMSKSYTYYGKNYSPTYQGEVEDLTDLHAGYMVKEACLAVADSVDFADYDWDGDGEVDQVYILYAGQGEASGGSTNTIWPHEFNLSGMAVNETIDSICNAQKAGGSGNMGHFNRGGYVDENAIYNYFLNLFNVKIDGKTIDTYACSNEVYVEDGENYLMGIGTICHEFSHCLGFPDTYDTQGTDNFGMGYWDVMASGSYNGPYGLGWKPAGYTAWERQVAGWLDYATLADNDTITDMPTLTSEPVAYKITNPANSNEYYILENRQQSDWDEYVPGSGLLVTHVDYDQDIWDNNIVNATYSSDSLSNDHQRMTIFHADNSAKERTYVNVPISDEANDIYPYNGNDSITDNSTPADTLYNKNTDGTYYMHMRLMSIRQNSDGTMAFLYNPSAAGSTSGIASISVDEDKVVAIYALDGRRMPTTVLGNLPQGAYILRMASGQSKKMVKR